MKARGDSPKVADVKFACRARGLAIEESGGMKPPKPAPLEIGEEREREREKARREEDKTRKKRGV